MGIAHCFSWFVDGITEVTPFINLCDGGSFQVLVYFFRNGDYVEIFYLIIQSELQRNTCFIFSLAAGLNLSSIELLMGGEFLLGKSRAVCSQLLKGKKKEERLSTCRDVPTFLLCSSHVRI